MVKTTNKAVKKTTKSSKIITVKNAAGDADTTAKILVQNHIKYTPRVSVIIPVYNVEKYLRECLDSIINQTLREIEIICVDDGSTDDSLKILQEYAAKDNRITVITQENQYAGVARNAGLAVARGEYLSFLDSDDFFEPNMLAEMYAKSAKLGLDICVCDADMYNDITKTYQIQRFLYPDIIPQNKAVFNKNDLHTRLYDFTNAAAWTKLYSREFVIKNNLYFQGLHTCNDIGMEFSALSLANKISIIDKVFVHYRYQSNTQVSSARGKTAINIIYAYYYIKQHLIDNKLHNLLDVLNNKIKHNIKWENSCCSSQDAKKFRAQAKQIMKDDFKMFQSCFKSENFLVHFFKHMGALIKSKVKRTWEYPIRVHEKHHRLKDKIREIKKSK